MNARDTEIKSLLDENAALKMTIAKSAHVRSGASESASEDPNVEEIAKLTSELIQQKLDYQTLNDQLQESMAMNIRYETEDKSQSDTILNLESQVTNLSSSLSIVENTNNQLKSIIVELTHELTTRDEMIQKLEETTSGTVKELVSKEKDNIMMKEMLSSMSSTIANSDSEEVKLPMPYDNKSVEMDKLSEELRHERDLVKHYKSQYNTVIDDIRTLADDYQLMQEKLKELASVNYSQEQMIKDLTGSLNQLKSDEQRKVPEPVDVQDLTKASSDAITKTSSDNQRTSDTEEELRSAVEFLTVKNSDLMKVIENNRAKISRLVDTDFAKKIKDLTSGLIRIENEVNKSYIRYLKTKNTDEFMKEGTALEDEKNEKLKQLEFLLDTFSIVLRS